MADLLTNQPSKKCPRISKELIEWLQAVYPPVTPRVTQSTREIWVSVGERQLVEKLKSHFDRQQKEGTKL